MTTDGRPRRPQLLTCRNGLLLGRANRLEHRTHDEKRAPFRSVDGPTVVGRHTVPRRSSTILSGGDAIHHG